VLPSLHVQVIPSLTCVHPSLVLDLPSALPNNQRSLATPQYNTLRALSPLLTSPSLTQFVYCLPAGLTLPFLSPPDPPCADVVGDVCGSVPQMGDRDQLLHMLASLWWLDSCIVGAHEVCSLGWAVTYCTILYVFSQL
jgi:hypothetical protein